MDQPNRKTLNDPTLAAARDRHVARLRRVFDGTDDSDTAFLLCGADYHLNMSRMSDVPSEMGKAMAHLASVAQVLRDPDVFRPIAFECDIFGVHFVDKILGADVFDLNGSWQVRPLTQSVGTLQAPQLDSNPTWRMARDFALAFVDGGVSVPYFGLPTIASALNIGVNLYGQELLAAMIEDPDAARHDLGIINDALCAMHAWYRANLPHEQLQPVVAAWRAQPPGFGQLCGCTTQLLSPRHYREFVAPFDAELLGGYPHGGMIHLCGRHTQHIPTWREMKELRSLQLNDRAADDLAHYWSGLREDQILYVNPTATTSLERIMQITGGKRVVIVADVKDLSVVRKRPPEP